MMIFAGNHDMTRIGDVIRKNPNRAKIAMAMLATMRGIPQIFYGDEMMLCSADLSQGHGGLRIDFPGGWAGDKTNLLTAEGRKGQHKELFDFSARLLNWRKSKSVIHNGETMHFMTRDNTYAYFRYDDTDAVFVYINNSGETKSIPWSNYAEIGSSLKDGRCVLTGEAAVVDDETKVAPHSVIIVEYKR
jgi:glycosidase